MSHTVLAVPVPALDAFARSRSARYDASFVSAEPDFGHAHVTLLGPWLPAPSEADLAVVAEVVAAEPPFAFSLGELAQTSRGLLHLRPAPPEPFARLTAALVAAFYGIPLLFMVSTSVKLPAEVFTTPPTLLPSHVTFDNYRAVFSLDYIRFFWNSLVVAVGTTVVRALETTVDDRGMVHPGRGWTDVVVTPGRGVRAVDGLVTGWHEPEATHLAMLEAIAGREPLVAAYEAAHAAGMRWHEFGDSHLILP